MQLREYISIILKSWWIILPLTFIALTLALVFSYQQTPIYEADSSYVVGLGSSLSDLDTALFALDTLTGRERIFVTYCEIMKSRQVINNAFSLLNMDITDEATAALIEDYTVTCSVKPESNVLLLITTGPSPELVENLNKMVGLAGIQRTNKTYPLFPLEVMDDVNFGEDPISPVPIRNAILGAALGVIVSVTLALMLDYLKDPLEQLEALSIRDPHLNVYNHQYFQKRLKEENNRARIRHRPISMALMKIIPNEDFTLLTEPIRNNLLRSVAILIQDHLRQGDILAYKGENVFEILLPETAGHESKDIILQLHEVIRQKTFEYDQFISNFIATSGLVESAGGELTVDKMLIQAQNALINAEQDVDNTVHLLRASARPFVLEDMDDPAEVDFLFESTDTSTGTSYVDMPAPKPKKENPDTKKRKGLLSFRQSEKTTTTPFDMDEANRILSEVDEDEDDPVQAIFKDTKSNVASSLIEQSIDDDLPGMLSQNHDNNVTRPFFSGDLNEILIDNDDDSSK